jgi:streptogramin lyase
MAYFLCRSRCSWLCVIPFVVFLISCSARPVQESPTATALLTVVAPTAENRIQLRISLPPGLHTVAFGNHSIWMTNPEQHTISRMDAETGKVVGAPIALDFEPREIAYGEDAVWVCSADRTRLARIDPETNEVMTEIDLRDLEIPTYTHLLLTAGEGAVWLTSETIVIQIDPHTNQLMGAPLVAGESIIAVALGHGTLWTGSHDDGIIARIDPQTHQVVAKIDMGFAVHGLAVGEESAWVLDEHGFAVVRIDPTSNQPQERMPIDFVGSNLAAGADSVWVAPAARDSGQMLGNDGIVRISEVKKGVVETIHVGDTDISQYEYYSVFFRDGSVWVVIDASPMRIVRISP